MEVTLTGPARNALRVAEKVAVKTATEIRSALIVMEIPFAPHAISPVNAVPVMVLVAGGVPLVMVSGSAISAIRQVIAPIAAEMDYVTIVPERC